MRYHHRQTRWKSAYRWSFDFMTLKRRWINADRRKHPYRKDDRRQSIRVNDKQVMKLWNGDHESRERDCTCADHQTDPRSAMIQSAYPMIRRQNLSGIRTDSNHYSIGSISCSVLYRVSWTHGFIIIFLSGDRHRLSVRTRISNTNSIDGGNG